MEEIEFKFLKDLGINFEDIVSFIRSPDTSSVYQEYHLENYRFNKDKEYYFTITKPMYKGCYPNGYRLYKNNKEGYISLSKNKEEVESFLDYIENNFEYKGYADGYNFWKKIKNENDKI